MQRRSSRLVAANTLILLGVLAPVVGAVITLPRTDPNTARYLRAGASLILVSFALVLAGVVWSWRLALHAPRPHGRGSGMVLTWGLVFIVMYGMILWLFGRPMLFGR